MKVWITKYALTKGIYSADVVGNMGTGDTGVCVVDINGHNRQSYFFRNDWHKTKKAAIARAKEMRKKKIASLKKQIKKIEGLDFDKMVEGD